MKISYADYIKKTDASVLVAEAIFSELELKYPMKDISEVAKTTSGGTPSRSNLEFYNGDIAWLKSGELNDGIIEAAEEFITEKALANSSAKLLPKNTLLLAMYGATAGRTGITKMEAATNQAICALFPKENVLQEYLFWFLRQYRHKFIEESKGGAQPNISQSHINKTKIPIPEKALQKQIATLLSKIEDEKTLDISFIPIEFREKVNKVFSAKNNVFEIANELSYQLSLVKNLRQQLLQDAVQGKLVKNTEGGESAHDLLKRIKAEKEQLIKDKKLKKEKELPPIKAEEIPFEIPDDWVWCRLGEIAHDTQGGKSPNCLHQPAQSDEWGVIKTTAVQEMYFLENENKVLPKSFLVSEQHKVAEGDILITRAGPKNRVGIVCCVENLTKNLILSDKTIRIKYSKELLHSKFIAMALNSPSIKLLIELKMTGMADSQVNISQDNIKGFLIPLPPLSIQHRIVEKVESLMSLCAALETSIGASVRENEALLQQVLREALQGD